MRPGDSTAFTWRHWIELGAALAVLAFSMAVNYWAGRFADIRGETAHTSPDLLLSFLPVVDLRLLFVWGFAAFVIFAVAAVVWSEGKRAAYVVWMYALLVLVRSLFIILTPMKAPEGMLEMAGDPLFDKLGRYLTFKHDLFFSSHTALPYLGFLVFRHPGVRWILMGLSVLLAATVLLCRVHYSIDVVAAYFITYAVYRLELRHFRWRYRAFRRRWVSGGPRPLAGGDA